VITLRDDGVHVDGYQAGKPFASFLPGIAGEHGKPLWAFYCNRGQCIASFGVRNRDGAMLEFHPANKAYALNSRLGFRSFFRFGDADGPRLHEAFQAVPAPGVAQRLVVRAHEIEIEETHAALGLQMQVVYFTLPHEQLPALVRRVQVRNIGTQPWLADVLDGLPLVVPYGLEEKLLKQLSRTMEAFAEVREVDSALPFFKLKVEPSDRPDVSRIDAGFFAFALQQGRVLPMLVDPDLVFGSDTSLGTPLAFLQQPRIGAAAARRDTLSACAFAQLQLSLAPGESATWDAYFGQAESWPQASALRERIQAEPGYAQRRQAQNAQLVQGIAERFALISGVPQLDAYSRQAFLDNTLRGGMPVVIEGPQGPRVFHTFTRKHGDLERDYNAFELAPTVWSQGNGNFRDVNQNRRNEHFVFPALDAANVRSFFELMQIDGNNPLVIRAESFHLAAQAIAELCRDEPALLCAPLRDLLGGPFSPAQLHEALLAAGVPLRPAFERILGHAATVQEANHGEGYWVDHWTYNFDLIDSYAALFPDRLGALLLGQRDLGWFDSEHRVQPRERKTVLRGDGQVRQLHAVVRDEEKAQLIAARSEQPQRLRAGHGQGDVYRSTLLAKIVSLLALKATLFDPFGTGLEMEAEKPGWCDALNGMPGLFGSSTHEAFALRRALAFARRAVREHLGAGRLDLPVEVASLLRSATAALAHADAQDFLPTWQQLADTREAFRAQTCLGVAGDDAALDAAELLAFFDAAEQQLARGLAGAVDAEGLPVSYYLHEALEYEPLPAHGPAPLPGQPGEPVFVRVRRFARQPLPAFLEGCVQALRCTADRPSARALHTAVRASGLFDRPLGMYRVNLPLDALSFEIGRIRTFAPGWLENESIFLHMHYKFLLETLRSGLAAEFFEDLKRGLVALHDPAVYGRSPLENSSFIASSRFPDARAHGTGFVARLSGATAEWISMLLHMGLGAAPFRVVDGALRFEPKPVLAGWLFTTEAQQGTPAGSFGFKLFGHTWVIYANPRRLDSFGLAAVGPAAFELHYRDGRRATHAGAWLPEALARDLRDGRLERLMVALER
jgi:hypothetical protein